VKKAPIIRSYKVLGLAEKRMSAKFAVKFVAEVTSPAQLEILDMQKNMAWFKNHPVD
jgi:ribosome-associated heat shock protein Hsp15